MKDGLELYASLREHCGSEVVYRHSLVKSFHYTEGVRHFAQNAGGGAYWLLDILATETAIARHVIEMGFALVELNVTGSKALLTVANDSGVEPFFKRDIDYTDCPEAPLTKTCGKVWKFYIEATVVGDNDTLVPICMLPYER